MFNTNIILETQPKRLEFSDILDKVSEYDIFKRYIGDFKIGKSYNSPLREDPNPSFGIFVSNRDGTLLYKDLANGECGSVFKFVKKLRGYTTYKETLEEIQKEMNLDQIQIRASRRTFVSKPTEIKVVRRPFSEKDLLFWKQFGISKETLEEYKVNALSRFLVNGEVKGKHESDNPIYSYKVFNKFKIYRPLARKFDKWRGNLSNLDIQGYEQLSENGNLLILTKSLKDVMTLHEMGYEAIAPPSESTIISTIAMDTIKGRFKRIVIFYDRDRTGMQFTRKLAKEYDLDFVFINKKHKTKDISDLVKKVGYAKAANIFEQMIN